ncbi:hypothetical protein KI387_029434, partial [Taxus chinensis]
RDKVMSGAICDEEHNIGVVMIFLISGVYMIEPIDELEDVLGNIESHDDIDDGNVGNFGMEDDDTT